MNLVNFLIEFKPMVSPGPNRKPDYQTVVATSASKNAFLILGDFSCKYTDASKTKYVIKVARFMTLNLNNDLNYCVIKDINFIKQDNVPGDPKPAFVFCLEIGNTPYYKARRAKIKPSERYEFTVNSNEEIRFHLNFDDDCTNFQEANSGDWPCNKAKIING